MNELDGKNEEVVRTAPPIVPQIPKQLTRNLQVVIPQELTFALSDMEFQCFQYDLIAVVNTWMKRKLLNVE